MKQTGKEEERGLRYLPSTAASSSLPLSGVFFVILLRALHTAKQQGRGFCCYFFGFFTVALAGSVRNRSFRVAFESIPVLTPR